MTDKSQRDKEHHLSVCLFCSRPGLGEATGERVHNSKPERKDKGDLIESRCIHGSGWAHHSCHIEFHRGPGTP